LKKALEILDKTIEIIEKNKFRPDLVNLSFLKAIYKFILIILNLMQYTKISNFLI